MTRYPEPSDKEALARLADTRDPEHAAATLENFISPDGTPPPPGSDAEKAQKLLAAGVPPLAVVSKLRGETTEQAEAAKQSKLSSLWSGKNKGPSR